MKKLPDEIEDALEFLKEQLFPIVIKADGLAAGKGVIIAESYKEAEKAVKQQRSTGETN